jgi:basic amino acid/polyamine antiporter, APA family
MATRIEPIIGLPPTARATDTKSLGSLLRVLGVGFALAIIIGNTLGAGILRNPAVVASQLPVVWMFIGVWIVGGLYALLGSFAISELSAMLPRAGGYFVFARSAFGEYGGFIVGWTDWMAQCGSTSAVALLIAEYLQGFFPRLAGHEVVVASSVAIFFGALQWRGINWGSLIQNTTTLAKTLAFLLFIAAAFLLPHTQVTQISVMPLPVGAGLITAIVLSLQAVIYTYDGWYGCMYFSEEVRNVQRDIPRSMISGVLSLMAIYVLVNMALVHVLSLPAIAHENMPIGAAMQAMFGPRGDTIIRLVMLVSMMSSINAYHLMASRIPFAMANNGMLFSGARRVNRGGTPTVSLFLSVLAAVIFIVGGKIFERVVAIMAFFFVADYAMAYAAVFVLRLHHPEWPRPYRAWGYPWTTGLALLGSIAFLVGAIFGDRENSAYAVLVLALSYPLFLSSRFLLRRTAGES